MMFPRLRKRLLYLKAKTFDISKTKVNKGTIAYHIVAVVWNVMDVLDTHGKKKIFYCLG